MFKYGKFFVISLSLIFLSSCIKVSVSTNAIADAQRLPKGFPSGASFKVVCLNKYDHMLSNKVSERITNALENKGFIVTEGVADYALAFSFDMSSSEHTEYVPIYTPGVVTVTHGTIVNNRGFGSGGYTQTSESSGKINYVPRNCTLFHYVLDIAIYDLNLYRKEVQDREEACSWIQQFMRRITNSEIVSVEDIWPKVQVWQARTVIVNESADLRLALAYLLIGMFDHFGRDTHGVITRVINGDDKNAFSLLCK